MIELIPVMTIQWLLIGNFTIILATLGVCIYIFHKFNIFIGKNTDLSSTFLELSESFTAESKQVDTKIDLIAQAISLQVQNIESKIADIKTEFLLSMNTFKDQLSKFDVLLQEEEELTEKQVEQQAKETADYWNAIINNGLVAFFSEEENQKIFAAMLSQSFDQNPAIAALQNEHIDTAKVNEAAGAITVNALVDQNPMLAEIAARVMGDDWAEQARKSPTMFMAVFNRVKQMGVLDMFGLNAPTANNGNHANKSKLSWK